MDQLKAGAAIVDITPPPGLMLAGFAARTEPATGAHDPITVRALVIGDTAIVVADVVGMQKDISTRIRAKCSLPDANVIVAATHSHGAPYSMPGRLGSGSDPDFMDALENGCVTAIDRAVRSAKPATLTAGHGADPDVARNRRHTDGILDRSLPVLRVRDTEGGLIAMLVSYACHPTVLGADNRLMTADYPHYLRTRIETEYPGAIAVFLNGCAGDANIGHSPKASWTTAAQNTRTFENAERLGTRIAVAAMKAPENPVSGPTRVDERNVSLPLERKEGDLTKLAKDWQAELAKGTAETSRAFLLPHWIRWAEENHDTPPGSVEERVSYIRWGNVSLTALPGEVFAETGLKIREASQSLVGFVVAYADDTPGYIPPASEFQFSGYEVDEAYRFLGLPGRFAPGCAELLANTAQDLIEVAEKTAQ